MKTHIVSLGGGVTSTGSLPLAVQARYPNDKLVLLIAVIKDEHPDVWRMCKIISEKTNTPVTYITYCPGHEKQYKVITENEIDTAFSIWDTFHHVRMIGSSLFDTCSSNMKREILKRYIKHNFDPANTVVHLGITHDERKRMIGVQRNWSAIGYQVKAPLVPLTKIGYDKRAESMRIFGFVPDLYEKGFAHNNCHGFCVKAGKKHLKNLLEVYPEVYRYHEEQELLWQESFQQQYTVLREQRNGKRERVTLRELRERIERTGDIKWSPDEADDNSSEFACNACQVF